MQMSEVRPERFVAGGEALARDADGRVVFVRGGLPGETVVVDTLDDKTDWSRGLVTEIVEASPDRVDPPCVRRHEGCGGCDWQHLAVPQQLPAKVEIVRDALRRTGKLPDAHITVGAAVSDRAYRTTIRVVGDADGRAAYRSDRSHETVLASGCLVAHPALEALLDGLVITPELEVTLRVSVATGEITARWDDSIGDVGGLPHDVGTGSSAFLHEEVAGHRFRVSAASFFQSGPQAAELLVEAVRRAAPELDSAQTVLDAYAGVGLFAVAATSPRSHVITVESSKAAVADCRVNLAGRSARIEVGEVGAWRAQQGQVIDVAIADPSRTGLGKPGVGALAGGVRPQVLVLVSCDPVSLARDTTLLKRYEYQHVSSEVIDLFPHTHHVETVTRFVLAEV